MFGRPEKPKGPYYDAVASMVAFAAALLAVAIVVYWSFAVLD